MLLGWPSHATETFKSFVGMVEARDTGAWTGLEVAQACLGSTK